MTACTTTRSTLTEAVCIMCASLEGFLTRSISQRVSDQEDRIEPTDGNCNRSGQAMRQGRFQAGRNGIKSTEDRQVRQSLL